MPRKISEIAKAIGAAGAHNIDQGNALAAFLQWAAEAGFSATDGRVKDEKATVEGAFKNLSKEISFFEMIHERPCIKGERGSSKKIILKIDLKKLVAEEAE